VGVDILAHTLTSEEQAAVTELGRRLRERFGLRVTKVAVYGSRARGDVHEGSDIDVLVLLDGEVGFAERRAVTRIACDVALEAPNFVELAPRTMSAAEFDRLLGEEWRFACDVAREGVPV
jgi:predicted nucleotidyltransferase